MTTLETPKLALKRPYCKQCAENRSGSFCYRCGGELVEGVVSCECGNDNIWPHERFCQECGKEVQR